MNSKVKNPVKRPMHLWEEVATNVHRMNVPGGWIYRVRQDTFDNGVRIAVTFVPFAAGEAQ